jgi:hypothetical protein
MPTVVNTQDWDGVTPPALPAEWVQPAALSLFVTEAANPISAPNTLTRAAGDVGLSQIVWNNAAGLLRDCVVSSYFTVDTSTGGHHLNFLFIARLQGALGAFTSVDNSSSYVAFVGVDDTGTFSGVGLDKNVSGTNTNLFPLSFGAAITPAEYYLGVLTTQASTITFQLQRHSDSKWLDDTGTWVTDPGGTTACIQVTDGSVLTPGYAGVAMFGASGIAGTRFDNFELQSFAGDLTAGTCYVRRVSDTSLSIDSTPTIQGVPDYSYQLQRSTDGVSFIDFGAPEVVPAGVQPTQVIDTGLTTGVPVYYQWVVTDSAGPPAVVTTNVASMAPRPVGRTYFVDTAGSDSNTGTSSGAPWATLAHATAYGLTPGDALLLKGGQTHVGFLIYYWVAGSYAEPISISSYDTGTPTIACGDSWGIRLVRCSGVQVSGLIVEGSGVSSGGVTTNNFNGIEIINPDATGELAQVWIDDVEVTGCYSGIEIRGSAQTGTIGASGFADVRVTNCYVHEVDYFGVQIRAVVLLSATGTTLTWSTFSLRDDRGSAANNYQIFAGRSFTGCVVSDCVVLHAYGDPARDDELHSGDGIMMKEVTNGRIERCTAHDCGAHGFGPAGIWLQEDTDCVIRWCEVGRQGSRVPIDGDGFDMDGGCLRCAVEYCYSHDCVGAGLLCGPYIGSAPPLDCVVRFFISVDDAVDSNASSAIFPYQGAQLDIEYCVLYSSDAATNATSLIRYGGGRQRHWNNILITDRTDVVKFYEGLFDGASLAIGNCYFAFGAGGPQWNWGDVDYSTLAAFRSGSGQELLHGLDQGMYTNPLLTAVGDHPDVMPAQPLAVGLLAYDPTVNSPTRGAGLDLEVIYGIDVGVIDFHGYPLAKGADLDSAGFDIGASKYGSGDLIPAQGSTPGEIDPVTAAEVVDLMRAGMITDHGAGSYVRNTEPQDATVTVANADGLLGRTITGGANGGRTVAQAFAASRNRVQDNGDGTFSVFDVDDTTVLWSGVLTRGPTTTGPVTGVNPTGGG